MCNKSDKIIKKFRHHTDLLFKINNTLKASDLYKLQVFSFMHDLVNNKPPGSYIPMTNKSNYEITTRQSNRLYITRPRTTFSSNLPNHTTLQKFGTNSV